jgi:hypothetical protein
MEVGKGLVGHGICCGFGIRVTECTRDAVLVISYDRKMHRALMYCFLLSRATIEKSSVVGLFSCITEATPRL